MPPKLPLSEAIKEFLASGLPLHGVKVRGADYFLISRDEGKVAKNEEYRKMYFASCSNQEIEELRRQLMDEQQRALDAEQRAVNAEQRAVNAEQRAADAEGVEEWLGQTQKALHRAEATIASLTARKNYVTEELAAVRSETTRSLQSRKDLQAETERKFHESQEELKAAQDMVAIQAGIIENIQAEDKEVPPEPKAQVAEKLNWGSDTSDVSCTFPSGDQGSDLPEEKAAHHEHQERYLDPDVIASALAMLREQRPDATEQDVCSGTIDANWHAHGYTRVCNEVDTPCGICASTIAKAACGRCDRCANVVCLACMKEYDTAYDALASPQYYLP